MSTTSPSLPARPASPPARGGVLTAVLRSRLWPAVPAYAVLVVFAWITVTLLFGPLAAGANAGTSLTWIVWWPVLPVLLFLGGRVWCAICPFGTVIDLVQKVSGLGRPVPGWLKRYGVWIIDGLFILVTFLDHTVGIVENPRGSGFLLSGIAVSALVMAVLFERRAWCRYVCFLGGLSGNYARAGLLQVRANTDACRTCETKACYRGGPAGGTLAAVPGCPMFEFPSAVQTSSYCNLCGNCVKACPSGALSVSLRPPLVELLGLTRARYPEAALAAVIAGIVLVQNATMLTAWPDWLAALTRLAFGSEALAFLLAFVGFMGAPVALFAASAWISNRLGGGAGGRENFTRFAYALIPLDLAGHIAHNLFHLLTEGGNAWYSTVTALGGTAIGNPGLAGMNAVQALQFGLLALGALGSLLVAWRLADRYGAKADRAAWPHLAALLVLVAVNVLLFSLPMTHRA